MTRLAAILITFWAGSLWTICGLVAPTVFAMLDDRRSAGRLVARFFLVETVIGVVVAVLLLAVGLARQHALPVGRLGRILIAVTAAAPLLSHLALGPLMEEARAAGNTARFGMLHGMAAALFVTACITALGMVWTFNRPAK